MTLPFWGTDFYSYDGLSLLKQKWNHTVLNGEHTGALSIQSFTAGFSQHPSPASYVVPSPTLPTSCAVTIMFSHLTHVPFAHPTLQYSTIHCPLYRSPRIMPKPSDTPVCYCSHPKRHQHWGRTIFYYEGRMVSNTWIFNCPIFNHTCRLTSTSIHLLR